MNGQVLNEINNIKNNKKYIVLNNKIKNKMKRKEKKEISSTEKVVFIAICVAIVAFLLRMWNPDFFRWFHIKSMQDVSFLRNIWQTIWLTFQIAVYLIWSVSLLWMGSILISAFISFIIGTITGVLDIIIAIWNLITWVLPLPRVEISISKSTFGYIEVIMYKKFGEDLFDIFPMMFTISVLSTIISLLLLSPFFWFECSLKVKVRNIS